MKEIFIRLATKKERMGGKRMAFLNIPNKKGYTKSYKPYGESGAGFYYIKITPECD
jgi:hypothetical protein